jgi:hypothetical protein
LSGISFTAAAQVGYILVEKYCEKVNNNQGRAENLAVPDSASGRWAYEFTEGKHSFVARKFRKKEFHGKDRTNCLAADTLKESSYFFSDTSSSRRSFMTTLRCQKSQKFRTGGKGNLGPKTSSKPLYNYQSHFLRLF